LEEIGSNISKLLQVSEIGKSREQGIDFRAEVARQLPVITHIKFKADFFRLRMVPKDL
jgi:hypothetical protein